MFKVINNKVYLTRGDSAPLPLDVADKDGNPYTPQSDDVVVLTVKKTTADTAYLTQKHLVDGVFSFIPTDTESWDYGDYVYDVQLTMANGYTDTIIQPSLFRIMEEVTF
ncbi:hypothetical protein AB840_09960 [Megasphaera cerevisiae DSM 20462]|uniref:BppU N-terminal domain-containing protein n=1 Tax=Megasphaera cerevisiae DSM 20462 TaxID=1122219 RepID=A0A0J6WRI4_9FIRM|nr:hypothetical protein [Megasphaera cerevisiae]KMO86060.1 hypothetical protein AB840_09960 [Megasphaera cerevisiae DSM 20462]SKA01583.1 hypothetical protein SAMN05660900_02124 [Megasphaera cerevisiae DSM 20462]